MKPGRIAFIFVDGVGIGAPGPKNPFIPGKYGVLEHFAGCAFDSDKFLELSDVRAVRRRLDANLGIDGLPQSGTGQATLFTGVNCAKTAGRHFGPYPHSATRPIIASANVFKQLIERGIPVGELTFANAFPDRFLSYAKQKNRWTVTTRCCLDANVPLRSMDDLLAGTAIAADFTGDRLRSFGVDYDGVTARRSGEVFGRLATKNTFTLCEYFLTDKAGHTMSLDSAHDAINRVDEFVAGLLDTFDTTKDLVLLTSDHGNVEDLGIRTHTRNPVPLVVRGPGAEAFSNARSLCDVVGPCVDLLTSK